MLATSVRSKSIFLKNNTKESLRKTSKLQCERKQQNGNIYYPLICEFRISSLATKI